MIIDFQKDKFFFNTNDLKTKTEKEEICYLVSMLWAVQGAQMDVGIVDLNRILKAMAKGRVCLWPMMNDKIPALYWCEADNEKVASKAKPKAKAKVKAKAKKKK